MLLPQAPVQSPPGTLISSQLLQTVRYDDLNVLMKRVLGKYNGAEPYGSIPPSVDGVTVWKVVYASTNFNNETVNLSGLVLLPQHQAKGLVVSMHGTAVGQNYCPSSGIGENGNFEAQVSAAAFASNMYAVALPDYIGQGVNREVHPYVMPQVNAKSGRDIAIAALALAQQKSIPGLDRLFVTGYSEGGANAMALAQLIENQPVLGTTLIASAPCSGPYDLSDAQRKQLLAPVKPNGDLPFAIPFLAAFLVYSTRHYYPKVVAEDVFRPVFWRAVPTALNGSRTSTSAGQLLGAVAYLDGYRRGSDGNYHLDSLLQASAREKLAAPDPTFPLVQVMGMYNTYAWKPTKPLYLVGLQQDTIVGFANTVNTMAWMRKQGIGAEVVNSFGVDAPAENHLTQGPGQAILARRFFDRGFAAVPKN